MKRKLPSKVLLRDRYGNIWHVKLSNEKENTYFHQGWETFIKQNYVERGDFFIFKYDGIGAFDVKLFGSDSCNKRGVGSLIYKFVEEDEEDKQINDNEDVSYNVDEEEIENILENNNQEENDQDFSSDPPFNSNNGSENVTGTNS